jgi:hypothetical protein
MRKRGNEPVTGVVEEEGVVRLSASDEPVHRLDHLQSGKTNR